MFRCRGPICRRGRRQIVKGPSRAMRGSAHSSQGRARQEPRALIRRASGSQHRGGYRDGSSRAPDRTQLPSDPHRHRRRRPCGPLPGARPEAVAGRRDRRGGVRSRPPARPGRRPRAFAIAAAARRMLQAFGCLGPGRAEAQPILDMVITDSRLHDPVRPVFLTFAGEVGGGRALRAHGRGSGDLTAALVEACRAAGRRASGPSGSITPARRRPASRCGFPTARPCRRPRSWRRTGPAPGCANRPASAGSPGPTGKRHRRHDRP